MPLRKRDDGYCRLVYLLKVRGHTFRDIQTKVINPIYKRIGRPELTYSGNSKKPHFLNMAEMDKTGKEVKDRDALEWAEKMLPEILNENGRIRDRFVIQISAGSYPTTTEDIADLILNDAEKGSLLLTDSERTDEEKAS